MQLASSTGIRHSSKTTSPSRRPWRAAPAWYSIYLLYWCFTGTKVHKPAKTPGRACVVLYLLALLVLYWYKSANADADGGGRRGSQCRMTSALSSSGTQFTCFTGDFTGTKVQILTQKRRVRLRFLKDMCKMLAKAQTFESEWEKIDGKLQARARSKVSVFVLLYQ
jgi:hypothetical protein